MLPLGRFPALRSNAVSDAERNIRCRHPGIHDFVAHGDQTRWSISINAVDLGRGKVSAIETGACSLTNSRDGMLRIFLPFADGLELAFGAHRRQLRAGRVAFGVLNDFSCHYSEEFRGLVIGVPQKALEEAMIDFGWRGDLSKKLDRIFVSGVESPESTGRHMLSLVRALEDAPDLAGVQRRFFVAQDELLMLQIARVLAGDDEPATSGGGALYLTRAIDFMHAHLFEEIGPTAVARAAGCSLRNLQLLFQRDFGETITGTLRQLRLQAVRARLENPQESDSVTSVAIDCGFFHLSDFARHYRQQFGELPSVTLARVRGVSHT